MTNTLAIVATIVVSLETNRFTAQLPPLTDNYNAKVAGETFNLNNTNKNNYIETYVQFIRQYEVLSFEWRSGLYQITNVTIVSVTKTNKTLN